jgi:rhodanese-related sulfurtransferase
MKKITSLLVPLTLLLFIRQGVLAEEANVSTSIDGTTLVNAEKVIELVESLDELIIIDARTTGDYTKGHIPDAIRLVNTETNADSLAKLIATKESPVLFYCNGAKCERSVESSKIAVAEGYSNVYWFRGGIQEWEAKGFPVEK